MTKMQEDKIHEYKLKNEYKTQNDYTMAFI